MENEWKVLKSIIDYFRVGRAKSGGCMQARVHDKGAEVVNYRLVVLMKVRYR